MTECFYFPIFSKCAGHQNANNSLPSLTTTLCQSKADTLQRPLPPADLIEGCQTSIFFASLLWSSLLVIHLITNIQLPEESGLIDT